MAKRFNYKADKTVMELIDELDAEAVTVRFEKGRFKSNDCIVDGARLLILNKMMNRDQIIDYLRNFLENLNANRD